MKIKPFLFSFLILPVFLLSATHAEVKQEDDPTIEVARLLDKAPRNAEEIFQYVEETCAVTDGLVEKILLLPKELTNFENTVRVWNKIGEKYFESLAFLHGIEAVTTDSLLIDAAKSSCEKLHASLASLLKDEILVEKLVSFLEESIIKGHLNPSKKYYFHAFLSESDEIDNPLLKERVAKLKEFFEEETAAFTPYLGNLPPKKGSSDRFSVLNWNVCFLPGFLPMTYGGMLPWDHRFDRVVDFIKKSEADVVCLQEVFQEEAAEKLYEALKGDYAYFYINIAPKNFGFNPGSISLGSGLFVASKYEIPSAYFAKYKETWIANITRGFFDFEITDGTHTAEIVTTHLDASLVTGSAENFRALQLRQMLSHLEEKQKTSKHLSPVIICGDLNVYWGYSEPAEGLMKKFFYDPYNQENNQLYTYCDYTGYWWPEYLLNKERKKFEPKPCILDYALILKAIPSGKELPYNHVAKTSILQANMCENPEDALSDHHALLTTFYWKPKK